MAHKKSDEGHIRSIIDKGASEFAVKLSVVIPAFNEEENIALLLEQFNELFMSLPYACEVIFINDGSSDATLEKARGHLEDYPWLRIFSHSHNRKLTAALQTGFSHCKGEILCFYPADLQYHANEIPRMVSLIDSGADIVTGWRQGKYGIRRFGSFVFNLLSRMFFGIKVHDLNSIKAFKKEVLSCFHLKKGWHSYMIAMAAERGYRIEEIKVRLYPRIGGKSKASFWRLPIGFLDLLSVKLYLSFSHKPFLFFGTAGFVMMGMGILAGCIALYLRIAKAAGYRPLLYLVLLLMVQGLLLFALGFLAELIVNSRDEIKWQNTRKNDELEQ